MKSTADTTSAPDSRQRPPAPDAALANLVVVLADNKYFLGRRLSEWAIGAPTLESAVACAAIAQEELGHTRPLYSFLGELSLPNPPVPLERDDDRERKYCLSFLRARFPSWPYTVAALLLVDGALAIMLEGLEKSKLEVLRRRASRIVADEPVHWKFAVGRVRELGSTSAAAELARRVDELLPEVLLWFGPPEEEGVEVLREAGLVELSSERLRQTFLGRVVPVLAQAGVRVGVEWNPESESWDYGALPWERWNSLERRLATAPRTAQP